MAKMAGSTQVSFPSCARIVTSNSSRLKKWRYPRRPLANTKYAVSETGCPICRKTHWYHSTWVLYPLRYSPSRLGGVSELVDL